MLMKNLLVPPQKFFSQNTCNLLDRVLNEKYRIEQITF